MTLEGYNGKFPTGRGGASTDDHNVGMSLRDWFAGQALVGIISRNLNHSIQDQVDDAYVFADVMIAESEICNDADFDLINED